MIVGSYVPEGVAVGRWVQRIARGVTAFYDIDTPVTLAKLERGDYEYLSPDLIPGYDLYLSFTGGPTLGPARCAATARRRRARSTARSIRMLTRRWTAEALGPELSRHLQPRPAADAGALADRAGAAAPHLQIRA